MTRFALALLILSSLFFPSCAAPTYRADFVVPAVVADGEAAQLHREVARYGVRVDTALPVGGESGSGVRVSRVGGETLVLTAYHVVRTHAQLPDLAKLSVASSTGGDTFPARLVAANEDKDLAVIAVADGGAWGDAFPAWAGDASYYLQRVAAYGHPGGIGAGHLTEGRVQVEYADGTRGVSSPMFRGNSGGGVYVYDGGWKLLGVAQGLFGANGVLIPHVGLISGLAPARDLVKVAAQVMTSK